MKSYDLTSKTSKFGDKMNERGKKVEDKGSFSTLASPSLFIQVVISKERERKANAIETPTTMSLASRF